jgi:hypothetical protein
MQIIFGISMTDAKMLCRCECFKKPMRMLKIDANEYWPMGKVIFPVVSDLQNIKLDLTNFYLS